MGYLLSTFLRDGGNGYLMHWCPGCKSLHLFKVGIGEPPVWTFNGNVEKPSFSPSMLINQGVSGHTCHYYLTDGVLQFCGDCDAHGLANQRVPLPQLPHWLLEDTGSEAECDDEHFYETLGAEDKRTLDRYIQAHWRDDITPKTYREWHRLARLEFDGWVDSTM